MSGVTVEQVRGRLPPWLWVWLVAYALSLPQVMSIVLFQSKQLFGVVDDFGGDSVLLARLYYLPSFLIAGTVLAGILTILLPGIRVAYLEKRFRLTASPLTWPALKEIADFIHLCAPDIKIKSNLLRTDQLAFVYPLGYRTTAIALFGGLVKLWRSDRKAAEAVILHEIAHYRNGDTLLVGAGSLFTTLIRYLPLLSFVCMLIAIPARSVSFATAHNLSSDSNALTSVALLQILALWGWVLLYVAMTLIVPVVGIWCTECPLSRGSDGLASLMSSRFMTQET